MKRIAVHEQGKNNAANACNSFDQTSFSIFSFRFTGNREMGCTYGKRKFDKTKNVNSFKCAKNEVDPNLFFALPINLN